MIILARDITISIIEIKPDLYPSRRDAELNAVKHCLEELGIHSDINHHPDGRPFLASEPLRPISITHSRKWAAVAMRTSGDKPFFGVDVEDFTRCQLKKVAPKFLSPAELEFCATADHGVAKAWTAKEAVFKALGKSEVNFADDISFNPEMTRAIHHSESICFNLDYFILEHNNILCVAAIQ